MKGWGLAPAAAFVVVASGIVAAPARAAADADPEVLSRTGKWVARHDVEACHLLAEFGTGDAQIVAMFTRYQPGDSFDLTLAGRRLRTLGPTVDAKIDFGMQPNSERDVMVGTVGQLPAIFLKSIRIVGADWAKSDEGPGPVTVEQESQATAATLKIQGKRAVRLATGSLGKPMAALRACTDGLIKSWGYDPAVHASLTRRATPRSSFHKWFSSGDYPTGALSRRDNGWVRFRVDVDVNGKIAGCHILARTEPDAFADHTCRLITKRAEFLPALDADGKPLRSYFTGSMRFRFE